MKKLKLFILAILMIGVLGVGVGCLNEDTLGKPTDIGYNVENELSWTSVEGAKGYLVEIVSVDTGEVKNLSAKKTSPKVDLSFLTQGDYEIRVRALGRESTVEGEWSETIHFNKGYETGCVYTLINNGTEYEISQYGTASGAIYIEDNYRDKPVTEIADRAFKGCSEIEYIYMGDNVRRIGNNAFYNCKNLKGVYFEDSSLEYIGAGAFQSCGLLEEFTLPEGVTTVHDSAFAYCRALKEMKLHDKVTIIDAYAFSNCSSLTNVEIPDSVTYIGNSAFTGCMSLQSLTIGKGLKKVESLAFYKCEALQEITFAQNGDLKSIGASAFRDCYALNSLELPEGLEDIENRAFSMQVETSTSVEGVQTVTSLSQLNVVEIPSTVMHVGEAAFFGTKLYIDAYFNPEQQLIYVDDWVVDTTFKVKTEKTIIKAEDFKENVCAIADSGLTSCILLEEIYLPETLKYIGNYAFRGNEKLRVVEAEPESNLVSIGKYAFSGCKILSYVIFRDGVESIGEYAFMGCERLNNTEDNVIVPDTVKMIGQKAFYGTKLESAPDKSGVIYAGNWIVGCTESTAVVQISEDAVGIATYAFANKNISTLFVPNKNKLTYIMRGAFYKCERLDMVNLSRTNVKEIGDYAFYGCKSLSNIELPLGLTTIGRSAFSQCVQLSRLDLSGNKLKTIGEAAFFECINLEEIELGSALTDIERSAFYKCEALKEVLLTGAVTSVGAYAFGKCKKLEKLTIGNQTTEIGDYAFVYCEALKSVSFPASVKKVGKYSFYGCKSLLIVNLNEGLEEIGAYAFSNASRLMSLRLASTLRSIGTQAFRGCASLTSVIVPAGLDVIGEHAFYGCTAATFYVEENAVTNRWDKYWNSGYRPVVWNCTLSEECDYVVSVTIGEGTLSNDWVLGGFGAPEKAGCVFEGWATTPNGEVVYAANEIVSAPVGTTLYAIWKQ